MKKPTEKQKIYVTTTLPYVNADPHIGFAMELIRADAMARFYELMGHEVFFNTGTDEHGQKIFDKSVELSLSPQEYVDSLVGQFKELIPILGIKDDIHFIRTTDEYHCKAAQELWKRCDESGFIYKKNYQSKYCVGCELEKTDSELVDGRCPIHPNMAVQLIDEENYFFRFSMFQDALIDLYCGEGLVVPLFRQNEIESMVKGGLQDFSISRLKSKMSWGIPVPGDDAHVMYVWFDALTNYIATLGWPDDSKNTFFEFWEEGYTVQYAGKDNLRQQSAMWQAMLLAVGIKTTDVVVINGFINIEGQKMSKSLGNVLYPKDIVSVYGTEALRYYLLRHVSQFEDSDVSLQKIHDAYHSHLVNGIGNLTSRIMKLAETHLDSVPVLPEKSIPQEWIQAMYEFDINRAMEITWAKIKELDTYIAEQEPYKVVKEDLAKGKDMINYLVVELYTIGRMLYPTLPETNVKVKDAVKSLKKPESIFERIERAN